MKRDLDLCRKILLYVRTNAKMDSALDIKIENYLTEDISYNLKLLSEAGFLDLVGDNPHTCLVWGSLTWDGQDFFDAMGNDTHWNKTKKYIKEKVGSVSFSVFLTILNEIAKDKLIPN
jgi:hypothetical protein